MSDESRRGAVQQLADLAEAMDAFVHGYSSIDDPAVDSTDEILNWCFTDVTGDLGTAIWCMSCGFYKASASSLRSALDLATAALYFQVREHTDPAVGAMNRFFAEWDAGARNTPNWGEMCPILEQQPSVQRFDARHGSSVIQEAKAYFHELSAYTHGRAHTTTGNEVRAISHGDGHCPSFDPSQFHLLERLTRATVAWICTLWQVAYPQILATEPLGSDGDYDSLFGAHDRARQARGYRHER